MHVVVAVEAAGLGLSAEEVARAVAAGWAATAPTDRLDVRPLSGSGLAAALADADLLVTVTAVLDAEALLGATGRAAGLAQESGAPCVVLAGSVRAGRRELAARGIDEALPFADAGRDPHPDPGPRAVPSDPARLLEALAARTARAWSPGQVAAYPGKAPTAAGVDPGGTHRTPWAPPAPSSTEEAP